MAFVGLKVPAEVARILAQIEVPGEREDSSQYHITMLNLGDEVSLDTIAQAVEATFEVCRKRKPFSIEAKEVSTFPQGNNGTPLIVLVSSDELQSLREDLAQAFDAAKVSFSKKFKEFIPHVTLSYLKEGEFRDRPLESIVWTAYEVVLWGGDKGDERLSVTFPFSLPGKTALWRKLIQAHLKFGPGA